MRVVTVWSVRVHVRRLVSNVTRGEGKRRGRDETHEREKKRERREPPVHETERDARDARDARQ